MLYRKIDFYVYQKKGTLKSPIYEVDVFEQGF